ncbi:MAG: Sir2 family NAD-dependent protein deacetylase [Sphaerochaetaceae bacterium]|nr:Sir2 family NAD-dependent protein deacetylase [Sphaerochaetaceae bacterium]
MAMNLIEMLRQSRHTVAFTGAGVSTLSGIRDFRGTGGFYTSSYHGMQVEELLSIELFQRDPSLFYAWAREFVYVLDRFSPSVVHTVLAGLESRGMLRTLYTQNIDMLHRKAGSVNVHEVHGSPLHHHCTSCHAVHPYEQVVPAVLAKKVPRCTACGGVVKPDIVFYGEQLDARLLDRAYREMAEADLTLVLGSSLTVQPAASLPMATYYHGGKLVIINAQPTPLDKFAKLRLEDLKESFEEISGWLDAHHE